ncbi:T9SS C-terminal target domain-containing protein [candidate division KSB1 bacterium]|nr:right-handed parallel beta-helix repeat-containing protein [candidate division KSB1 bacterium]RQW00124.1 MAG: T9SS C-terminal target domain-containing protein [candidate division KSB1 bacterium]
MRNLLLFATTLALCLSVITASATTYYVDPVHGDINNVGNREQPWSTLEQVFRSRKALAPGDTLFLLNGHHGSPVIRGVNSDYIVISALQGHVPACQKVTFSAAAKWEFADVTISPETAAKYVRGTLVTIDGNATDINVENCRCYSVLDNSPWSRDDWVAKSCTGAQVEGDRNVIRNCSFLNVKHGILVESAAEHNLIDRNIIENFAADGMRGIGSYNTFQYNTVKNCYDVDDNHDDGFQSYSYGPDGVGKTTVRGVVLRGNTIINYDDSRQKFRGTLQGIGCFDGMYEDWIIENNVIITDHWHGISLYGAHNCKIVNNTVIDQNDMSPGPPWIKITAHKNGTNSTENIIRNNLTTSLSNDANIGTVDHNMSLSYTSYGTFFVDFSRFDLSLRKGCRAIDRGTEQDAPTIDILGTSRPQGDGYDIGAYEYVESSAALNNPAHRPVSFRMDNHPNPFNPTTTITYSLPHSEHVVLNVYNVLGCLIQELVNERQRAGDYAITFDGANLSSGVFLCRLTTDSQSWSKRMLLLK